MKNKLIFILSFLLVLSTAYAGDTATLTYSLDDQGTGITTIVSNVPFKVNVDLALNNDAAAVAPIFQFNIFSQIGGAGNSILSNRRGNLLSGCVTPAYILNTAQSNTLWRYFIDSSCAVTDSPANNGVIRVSQLSAQAAAAGALSADAGLTELKGPGSITYTLTVNAPFSWVALSDSSCGDGVVDADAPASEKCDDNNQAGGDGCSAQCKVELGWACTRTSDGDRKSACTMMPPTNFFLAKMQKLLTGQCYPENVPGALYCDESGSPLYSFADGKLTGTILEKRQKKSQLISDLISDFLALLRTLI